MKGKHQDTKALSDVLAEMQRRMPNGADRNQDPFIWGAILGEEVGEFHQAVLHDRFGGKAAGTSRGGSSTNCCCCTANHRIL